MSQTAFQCRDSDKQQCKAGLDRCRREQQQDTRADMQLPWVATALAIAVGPLHFSALELNKAG